MVCTQTVGMALTGHRSSAEARRLLPRGRGPTRRRSMVVVGGFRRRRRRLLALAVPSAGHENQPQRRRGRPAIADGDVGEADQPRPVLVHALDPSS